ncbi:MAG TPA: molybdopterin-dependent oxidoreductase, partial [Actinomycetota bacterium]|nr:molybdopterin-dependent oxidoreductase [Actinomycetota bacterium]
MKRFFAGVAAAAVGLGIVYAISTLFPVVPYPPVALAGILRDAAPGGVATALIEGLKHTAKSLLSLLVHIGILASVGGAGLWVSAVRESTRRARRAAAVGAATALFQIGLVAISPEHFGVLAVITYLGAAYFVGRVLSGSSLAVGFRRQVRDGETPLDAIQRSRRRFIVRALSAVVGVIAGGAAMLRVGGRKTPIDLKLAEPAEPVVPPARDPSFPNVPGLSSEITSVDDFYNVDINIIKPAVDHTTWRLKIHGLVESPYSLSYRTMQSSFEVVELAHTLSCISNEVGGDLISTAIWRGVRLRDVLRRAGLRDGVVDVVFRAADGYSDSIPLTKALEETTLLVFGM